MPHPRSRGRFALLALVAFSIGAVPACALEPEPPLAGARPPRIELTVDAGGEAVEPLWSTAASLTEKRINHTLTALANGEVMVTGGNNFAAVGSADMAVATTEIRDPATGTWAAAAPMTSTRLAHTATLLGNGKLLVVGGTTTGNETGALASVELYDPATNTWAAVPPITVGRYGHKAVAVGPGNTQVLIVGGVDGSANVLASAELYDSATNTWTAVPSMATARISFTLTTLASGKLLVVGGKAKSLSSIASAELYDPASNTWTATAPLHTSRYWHTATLLQSGKVLVAAGSNSTDPIISGSLKTAEIYDPLAGTWSDSASLATYRGGQQTATPLANGGVLVIGGEAVPGTTSELYDPSADAWTDAGDLAVNRSAFTALLLDTGSVLVVGGVSASDSRICKLYTSAAAGAQCTSPVECQSGSCTSGACAATPSSSASSGAGGSGGAGGATSTAVGASSTAAGAGGGASAQGGGDKLSACSVGDVVGRSSSSFGPWVALGVMIALRRRKVSIDSATASKRRA